MEGASSRPGYVITTVQGAVPYIAETGQAFLQVPRKVLLDDFLYRGSFYDLGGTEPLRSFIGSDVDVCLGAKERPALLRSKRGNFRVSRDCYAEVVARMGVEASADYATGKIVWGGAELVEPADLCELHEMLGRGVRLFGTGFVNRMTEAGSVLCIEDGRLVCRHIDETDHGYAKYMLSINEMGAFTFISENNYRVLFEFFASL